MRHRVMGLLLSTTLLLGSQTTHAALPDHATLYKSPACGCCAGYADYLMSRGIDVDVVEDQPLDDVKARLGVPQGLGSCHTVEMGGYVIEGHVPGPALDQLFKARPDIDGIGLAGMPIGTPGMPGKQQEAFNLYQFSHSSNDEGQHGTFMILSSPAR